MTSAANSWLVKQTSSLAPIPWIASLVDVVEASMDQDGGHDLAHLWRVMSTARQILELEDEASSSWPTIVAAVLLHDLVNLPKNHPERRQASSLSARRAEQIMTRETDLSAGAITLASEAIRCHSFSSGLVAESTVAQIVSDADRLDSIGAFAIARTFYCSGAMGRAICHPIDPFGKTRTLDDTEFGLDHFYLKLLTLKDRLYTESARQIAETRHAFMLTFLDALAAEQPTEAT